MKMLAIALLAISSLLAGCVAYEVPARDRDVYHGDRDRDGRPDRMERDRDHDGVPNRMDRDRDGDGVRNREDRRPDDSRRY